MSQLRRVCGLIGQSHRRLTTGRPLASSVPLRPPTIEDTMEPYGSWKQAYEAEKKLGNRTLLLGVLCFTTSLVIFYQTGTLDGVIMPNLDNIMEETEPFEFDKTDRVTV